MSIYAILCKNTIVGLYTAETIKSLYNQLVQVYGSELPDTVDIVHIGDISGYYLADTGCLIKPLPFYDEANYLTVEQLREAATAEEKEE